MITAHLREKKSVAGCFFLLVASCIRLLAQPAADLQFEHLTIAQGLSQNTIYCILQDSQGFMWFGTENGLNRYDGYSVVVYRHDPANTASLSDNTSLRFSKIGRVFSGSAPEWRPESV